MTAYYNEFDPQAAAWLRELIKQGHIAPGDVDERDMREVSADDIRGYTQHHFFAGIGGWSLALRLAGWPDSRPVLTGSPPCQPFSSAGKGLGAKDERHLAPHFLSLVAALRPAWVFGEQVAAAVKKDNWLDDLLDALEGEGYATGAIVLPACGLGAAHIRQRLWFTGRLGDGDHKGLERHGVSRGSGQAFQGVASEASGIGCQPSGMADTLCSRQSGQGEVGRSSDSKEERDWQKHRTVDVGGGGGVENTGCSGAGDRCESISEQGRHALDGRTESVRQRDWASSSDRSNADGSSGRLADTESQRSTERQQDTGRRIEGSGAQQGAERECSGTGCRLADTEDQRCESIQNQQSAGLFTEATRTSESEQRLGELCTGLRSSGHASTHATHSGWDSSDWLFCRDGKWRPVEPGTFPLAHGLPRGVVPSGDPSDARYAQATQEARVTRLRGYGNAIVPQVAVEVIKAAQEG